MRILLVEDDPRLGSILERTLKEESYAVDWCTDGLEAEWMAFEHEYDLILLDLMIPRKSGLEVLKALRGGGIKNPYSYYYRDGRKQIILLKASTTAPTIISLSPLASTKCWLEPELLSGASTRKVARRQRSDR